MTTPTHIGIVSSVDDYYVYTIEGNTSDRNVGRRQYELDDENIVGYSNTARLMEYAEIDMRGYECGMLNHTHDETCLDEEENVVCGEAEHTHSDSCLPAEEGGEDSEVVTPVYYCGSVAHTHGDECFDEKDVFICEVAEHIHTEECTQPVEETPSEEDPSAGDEVTEEETVVYYCGIDAHTHGDECFDENDVFICETAEHIHTEECTQPAETPVYYCGMEEHVHAETCYDGEGNLICGQEEHAHTEECTQPVETPVYYCGMEEHVHAETCYDAEGNLICGQEEHAHTEECTQPAETPVYYCGMEEHAHGETCYDAEGNLICGQEEHAHTEECTQPVETPVYYCGMEEHAHAETCYDAEGNLICGQEEHVHTEECLLSRPVVAMTATPDRLVLGSGEVQIAINITDGTAPYTAYLSLTTGGTIIQETTTDAATAGEYAFALNPTAYGVYELRIVVTDANGMTAEAIVLISVVTDESATQAEWEAAIAAMTLTGDIRTDATMIANSQVGYAESLTDVAVDENGVTSGYSHFGAWNGTPYADWNVAFANFVLQQAGAEGIPQASDIESWTAALTEAGIYYEAAAYIPMAGDVVFIDSDGDGIADRTGIITQRTVDPDKMGVSGVDILNTTADTEAETTEPEKYGITITTAQGDVDGMVQQFTYELPDAAVVGYAKIAPNSDQDRIERLVADIEAYPSSDEIWETTDLLYEAGDVEAEMAYYETYGQMGADLYWDYILMPAYLQPYVTNIDRLIDSSWFWSRMLLIEPIKSDPPSPIASAHTSDFIELNLYDYNGKVNTNYNTDQDYPGFQWNGGAYLQSSTYNRHAIDFIDFGNSLITDFEYGYADEESVGSYGYSVNRQNIGNQGGNINAIVEYPSKDYANKPVGISNGTEVLSRTLGSDGYPYVLGAGSMKDYFSNSSFSTKKNSASIDGLFLYDSKTGAYYYNSRWNHAQYSNNKFQLYDDIITPNFITYPFGNFLPLNDITNSDNATQVSKITNMYNYVQEIINTTDRTDPTAEQLFQMLAKYRNDVTDSVLKSWTGQNAILDYFTGNSNVPDDPNFADSPFDSSHLEHMYNIDWDVDTNFFFGMEMKMNFMQPKDGMTGNDTNKDGEPDYPMVFYFTGDDDVWVFIDGVLFLDLSGIHRHVGGEIDFVNGKVHYYYLDVASGDVSTTPYATYTFTQLLTAAGASTSSIDTTTGTFKDYSVHDFNFYYMERGSGSSVCRLNFNFPLLRKNPIAVTKQVTYNDAQYSDYLGNPDYSFQILKAVGGEKTDELFIGAGVEYHIYENGEIIGIGTTDANGVFTLKAGQTARFNDIAENAGSYYVREIVDLDFFEQYGTIKVDGTSVTKNYNITVDNVTFGGVESGIKDMSDGETAFTFNNGIAFDELGTIKLTKKVTNLDGSTPTTSFTFNVELDGVAIPVGTEYTVTDANGVSTTKKVETAGKIVIKANETATISNIIAGTQYHITEDAVANGYTVIWDDGDASTGIVEADNLAGTIIVGTPTNLTVNNKELGASIEIPVQKTVENPDGMSHAYTFSMVQVNADGTEITGAVPQTITVETDKDSGIGTGKFLLNYRSREITTTTTYYYKITEVSDKDDTNTLYDTTGYLVKVVVTPDAAKGTLVAEATITGETQIAFKNVLLDELEISKVLEGEAANELSNTEFTFDVEISYSGSAALPDVVVDYPEGSKSEDTTVAWVSGDGNSQTIETQVTIKGGETVTITGLPIGATWKVTETNHDGYWVKNKVNDSDAYTESDTTDPKTIQAGGNSAEFVNTTGYEMPLTGGPGTYMYTAGGTLLVIAAAVLLYNKKCRKGVS